jgi:hypothetical protein
MVEAYNRDRLLKAQDRLFDLLVQHDEATQTKDWQRASALRTQVDAAKTRRDQVRPPGRRKAISHLWESSVPIGVFDDG